MRWLILAALLAAPPAYAAVAVIAPDDASLYNSAGALAANMNTMDQELRAVTGWLESTGSDFDIIDPRDARTERCRLGVFAVGGVTRTYDAVIHTGFFKQTLARMPGYRPDSLLLSAVWNRDANGVPQVFLGAHQANANWIASGEGCNTCSTGVSGPSAAWSTNYNRAHVTRVPTTGEVWRLQSGATQGFPAQTVAGIRRHFLTFAVSASGKPGGINSCTDCDSSGVPDSLVVWARYRSSAETAPLIFAAPGSASGVWDWGIVGMALAVADSITGGAVFGSKQIKAGLYVEGGFSRGRYDATGTNAALVGGAVCNASICDTANVKASIDSLAALATRTGLLKLTLGTQIDSVAAYAYEKAWWSVLGNNIRYSPRSNTGLVASQIGSGNASITAPKDVWGMTRARGVCDFDEYGDGHCDALADTAQVYCGLLWQFALMQQQFPGKVSRVVKAPWLGDYSPTTMTRQSARLTTSTLTVYGVQYLLRDAYRAGVRGILANLYDGEARPGASAGVSSGGFAYLSQASPNPIGYGLAPNRYAVFAHDEGDADADGEETDIGEKIGSIAVLGSQIFEPASSPIFQQGHDYAREFGAGLIHKDWQPANVASVNSSIYIHEFHRRTRVFVLRAVDLGGTGDGSRAARPGWWHIKWMVNRMSAINRLAGRTIITFAHLDELEP